MTNFEIITESPEMLADFIIQLICRMGCWAGEEPPLEYYEKGKTGWFEWLQEEVSDD